MKENEGGLAIAIAGAGPAFAREGPAFSITREKVCACHSAEGWKLAATTIALKVWSAFTFALEGFLAIEIAIKDFPSSALAIKGTAPVVTFAIKGMARVR